MKKIILFGMVMTLVLMFSAVAIAGNNNNDNDEKTGPGWDEPEFTLGVGLFEDYEAFRNLFTSDQATGIEHRTITNARVTAPMSYINYDPGDQDGEVIIRTLANIPCYLEMELIGNAGWTKIKSTGTGSSGVVDRSGQNHWMIFDSYFGGFVNEDWESIGEGYFSQIGPAIERETVYLQACDLWTANLYANINYGLDVTASALVNGDEDELMMDMRHTELGVSGWTEALGIGTTTVGTWNRLEAATVFMQFRVPFVDVPAGAYEGDVTFRIYSI